MKRKARNLNEPADVVLMPDPARKMKAWLRGGPCDGTMVEIPVGTERLYHCEMPPELALTPQEALPRLWVYAVDLGARSGGFNAFAAEPGSRPICDASSLVDAVEGS